MWSETYNRKQTDLLTLQTEIARDVSSKIKTKLSGEDLAKVTKSYTTNEEAYQLYLKGNFYTSKFTKEGFDKGSEYLEQAIKLDPDYALAYNGLAYNQLTAMDWFSNPKIAAPKHETPSTRLPLWIARCLKRNFCLASSLIGSSGIGALPKKRLDARSNSILPIQGRMVFVPGCCPILDRMMRQSS